jgi:hypothetical protein
MRGKCAGAAGECFVATREGVPDACHTRPPTPLKGAFAGCFRLLQCPQSMNFIIVGSFSIALTRSHAAARECKAARFIKNQEI